MRSLQFTVGTTAVKVISEDDKNRYCYLHHDSNQNLWLGGSNVTSGNGLHFPKEATMEIFVPLGEAVWAISDTVDQVVAVLTPNAD